jgi:hypothetical protein
MAWLGNRVTKVLYDEVHPEVILIGSDSKTRAAPYALFERGTLDAFRG